MLVQLAALVGVLAVFGGATGNAQTPVRQCGGRGFPQYGRGGADAGRCDDLELNGQQWNDADGAEYNCQWYGQGNRCEEYGDSYANQGLTANDACCQCGGGKKEDANPLGASCTDKARADGGGEWHGDGGSQYNCAYYAAGSNCQKYGDRFRNYGFTANEACCVCGGGDTVTTGGTTGTSTTAWDLMQSDNERAHNTAFQSRGSKADLVLRRGETFTIRGTQATFALKSRYPGFSDVFILASSFRSTENTITLPPDLPVGRFELYADEELAGNIVVLFNPWSASDIVFMSNSKERDEYIKAQTTRYYSGNVYGYPRDLQISGETWQLNTATILDDVLDLLAYTLSDWEECGEDGRAELDLADPIKVARAMSYMGASGATHGVVRGRWDGKYGDGKSPGYWTGTKQLLDAWKKNNQRPVKYGQCWVFGCTLTSFMRSLGIPARVISNFNSAHDTPQGTISTFYGTEPRFDWIIEPETKDSVWNFHVWVNVWMTRPDLDAKNIGIVPHAAGWNDIDSTPQELSDFKYQLGPANHNDMKNNYAKGNQYDTRFVMGEYNAYHSEKGAEYVGRYTLTGMVDEPESCGTGSLYIGEPGSFDLVECTNDITANHKPAEPSNPPDLEETFGKRRSLDHGEGLLLTDHDAYMAHDYHAYLAKKAMVGEDIEMIVDSHHEDYDMRTITVDVRLATVDYRGKPVGHSTVVTGLRSTKADKLVISVPYEKYAKGLDRAVDFEATLTINDGATGIPLPGVPREHVRFTLEAPLPQVTVGADNEVAVSWQNPLTGSPVRDVRITLNGPDGSVEEFRQGVVGAGASVRMMAVVGCGSVGDGDRVVVAVTTGSLAFAHLHIAARLNNCVNK